MNKALLRNARLLLALPALMLFTTTITLASGSLHAAEPTQIRVYKTPTCGCCGKWVDHLRRNGFDVDVITVASTRAAQAEAGVPQQLGSCHTALIGDYWVEGHVPADVIKKLLAEKPAGVLGISVPGMPPGSPGMEHPSPVQYDVIAYGTDGKYSVYARPMGHSEPQ